MRSDPRIYPLVLLLAACGPKSMGSLLDDDLQSSSDPGGSVSSNASTAQGDTGIGGESGASTGAPPEPETTASTSLDPGTSTGTMTDDRTIVQVSAHSVAACALLSDGAVRCWGSNEVGELGHGNDMTIGDDEHPWAGGDLQLSGPAQQIAVGGAHACALLASGEVQCWGHGNDGSLGYGSLDHIGDDEVPAAVGTLDLDEPALQLFVSWRHNFVLLAGGRLRCWGFNIAGNLGYGHTQTIGDDETLAGLGDVSLGGEVVDVSLGLETSCAILAGGDLRCWGNNYANVLGYAGIDLVGDDELPSDLPPVDVGGPVVDVAAGAGRRCRTWTSHSTGPHNA